MDELKKYIEVNRESLDVDLPGEKVWKGIQAASAPLKSIRRKVIFFRVAAAAAVLLTVGIGIKWLYRDNSGTTVGRLAVHIIVKEAGEPVVKNFSPVDSSKNKQLVFAVQSKASSKRNTFNAGNALISSIRKDYTQVVNMQLKSIKSIPVYGESPAYFDAFKNELQQLDLNEHALRAALKQNGMKDELLEKLIDLYQQKLNLLITLRREINKMNDQVEDKSTSTAWYFNI